MAWCRSTLGDSASVVMQEGFSLQCEQPILQDRHQYKQIITNASIMKYKTYKHTLRHKVKKAKNKWRGVERSPEKHVFDIRKQLDHLVGWLLLFI